MNKNNFDWMLVGCHALSDIAMAYFPGVRTDSATRSLRRLIVGFQQLRKELCQAGYTEHTTLLTPIHIAALIRALGMPGMARKEAEAFYATEK